MMSAGSGKPSLKCYGHKLGHLVGSVEVRLLASLKPAPPGMERSAMKAPVSRLLRLIPSAEKDFGPKHRALRLGLET